MINFSSKLNITEPLLRYASCGSFYVKRRVPLQGTGKVATISGSIFRGHKLANNTQPLKNGSTSKMFIQAALIASLVLCTIFANQPVKNISSAPISLKPSVKLLAPHLIDLNRYVSSCKLLSGEMTGLGKTFLSLKNNFQNSRFLIEAEVASSLNSEISEISNQMTIINTWECSNNEKNYEDMVDKLMAKVTKAYTTLLADTSIALANRGT